MSSTNSPCAACKLQRRKCTQECIYAPYFPPDQPQKFAYVHRVFGASNVAKLLVDLNAAHREDAVNSLAYEAEARLRDPVYGCVGLISFLQQNLKQIQLDLFAAKKELAAYIGYMPQPHMAGPSSSSSVNLYDMSSMMGHPTAVSEQQQEMLMAHPTAVSEQQQEMLMGHPTAVSEQQQEMWRNFEQQQRQQEFMRFNSGFDAAGGAGASGFNQMPADTAAPPSLTLGKFDNPF